MARALEERLYRLFYDGEALPKLENLPKRKTADDIAWGSSDKEARVLTKFRRLLGRIEEKDIKLLMVSLRKWRRSATDESRWPPDEGNTRVNIRLQSPKARDQEIEFLVA